MSFTVVDFKSVNDHIGGFVDDETRGAGDVNADTATIECGEAAD